MSIVIADHRENTVRAELSQHPWAAEFDLGLRWRNETSRRPAQFKPWRVDMNAFTPTSGPGDYCDDGLRLRHKVQKLRWMGFEREADQLAHDISELACQQPIAVPCVDDATD